MSKKKSQNRDSEVGVDEEMAHQDEKKIKI